MLKNRKPYYILETENYIFLSSYFLYLQKSDNIFISIHSLENEKS